MEIFNWIKMNADPEDEVDQEKLGAGRMKEIHKGVLNEGVNAVFKMKTGDQEAGTEIELYLSWKKEEILLQDVLNR